MAKYKIKSPNKQFNGVSAGATFVNGEAVCDSPTAIEWFKAHGYTIDDSDAKAEVNFIHLTKELAELRKENADLKKENDELKKENELKAKSDKPSKKKKVEADEPEPNEPEPNVTSEETDKPSET